ncbi:MAG: HAMP domain-containing histidine kinase [Archaeoglobus sp.]|uniref:sensor histidine kinase n=1 Tax=Archaeoglobus sp. TaxID=1872626 RepID=UPI001D7B975A|nr:HAMP domain-containing sensor histidine kinase [Archaeoglobus sp.]MBO8180653.1 HAMP domain-containing histidine kinase [Archaeoglobus sp.]
MKVKEISSGCVRGNETIRLLRNSIAVLRHDVMNALTSSLLYLEMYGETRNEEHLEKAKASIHRAIFSVKNSKLLEEFAIEGERKYFKVEKIVKEVAKYFDIPITVKGECQIFANGGVFSTIFGNLFQNAVWHSGTDRIDVRIERGRGKCFIRVIDYGKGISDDIKNKIFSSGFKGEGSTGTGQGLHIVKELVKSLGGKIWVEDNEPRGTVFVMEFPRRFFIDF